MSESSIHAVEGIGKNMTLKEIEENFDQEQTMKMKKRGNFILRQEIKDLTPRLDSFVVIVFMSFLTVIFGALAYFILNLVSQTVTYEVNYDDCLLNTICKKEINITSTLTAPVFIHYNLGLFYNNHKEYVKSRSTNQLTGKDFAISSSEPCNSTMHIYEMFDNDTRRYKSFEGKDLTEMDISYPCGLIAKSMFNDTFNIMNNSTINLNITRSGIANSFILNEIYDNNKEYINKQWLSMKNEDFVIWNQMDTLPNIKKLYGIINNDMKGTYYITINNSKHILN